MCTYIPFINTGVLAETTVGARKKIKATVMDSLGELEAVQTRILQRITELELSLQTQRLSCLSISPDSDAAAKSGGETIEVRLAAILRARGIQDFQFKRVPHDYYDRSLEARREILDAASIHHLCKSIVMVLSFLTIINFSSLAFHQTAFVQDVIGRNALFLKIFLRISGREYGVNL